MCLEKSTRVVSHGFKRAICPILRMSDQCVDQLLVLLLKALQLLFHLAHVLIILGLQTVLELRRLKCFLLKGLCCVKDALKFGSQFFNLFSSFTQLVPLPLGETFKSFI